MYPVLLATSSALDSIRVVDDVCVRACGGERAMQLYIHVGMYIRTMYMYILLRSNNSVILPCTMYVSVVCVYYVLVLYDVQNSYRYYVHIQGVSVHSTIVY